MKVRVISPFFDKFHTDTLFEKGAVLEFDDARANDIISKRLGVAVTEEPKKEPKPEPAKEKVKVVHAEEEKVEEANNEPAEEEKVVSPTEEPAAEEKLEPAVRRGRKAKINE